MIIVEGLDNTGKTTLVESIRKEFPILKHRPSIGNKHDPAAILEQAQIEAFSPQTTGKMISDRSRLISEYVYNPIIKKRPLAYPPHTWLEMLGSFADDHHLVIYCYRSTARLVDTWGEREQLDGAREHLYALNHSYDLMMHTIEMLFRACGGADKGSKVISYTFEANNKADFKPMVFSAIRTYLHEEAEIERQGLR